MDKPEGLSIQLGVRWDFRMKKMILISPHDVFPPKDGGERRIYLLTRELAKSYDVIFVGPYLENKKSVDIPINIVEVFPNKAKYKTFNIYLIKF